MQPEQVDGAVGRTPGSGRAWAGAAAAVFAAGSLAFHAVALVLAGLVPSMVRLAEGDLVKAELENGQSPTLTAPFAAAHEALADLGPPTLTCLGLAVVLALFILVTGVALTFRARGWARRLLRGALFLEGVRAFGWAGLVEWSLGDRARVAGAAIDKASAPLLARGAGMEQEGLTEIAELITSPLVTWGPALLQVAIVIGLYVWVSEGDLPPDGGRSDQLSGGELVTSERELRPPAEASGHTE